MPRRKKAPLEEYAKKRRFDRTTEPAPAMSGKRSRKLRFVIHEHHARSLHWDLRLEHEGVLASWAIPKGLPVDPGKNRLAVHVEDHPLSYIDFEGTIPEGEYGAGEIKIWDRGTYEARTYSEKKVVVTLEGERARGQFALFQTDGKNWLIHRMDRVPGREPPPEDLRPMLARAAASVPEDERGWAYEIKWDGIRALVFVEGGRARIVTRNGHEVTQAYPEVARIGRELGARTAVLDGEIVALENGRASFERLQGRMNLLNSRAVRARAKTTPVHYMIFDVLYFDGHSVLARPYSERRKLLESLGLDGAAWQTPASHRGDGRALLEAAREKGLEGLVAKRLDAPYEPGKRSGTWLKIRAILGQELVIGGYVPGKGGREGRVGALLVGYYDPKQQKLHYAGKVGTGYSEESLDLLGTKLRKLARETSPFDVGKPPRDAVFAEPALVGEFVFTEWTKANVLRQPVFKGLRADKDPHEVVREVIAREEPPPVTPHSRRRAGAETEVEGTKIKLSNLDKVLYPETGFTKGQVIEYYRRIAPAILPHLAGRPITLKRYPDGVAAESFFEKNCPAHRPPWVKTVAVWSRGRGANMNYCLVEDAATLVWTANLAAIELHPQLARGDSITRPTSLVFDLDPGAPAGLVECAEVALLLREVLDVLGLRSFAKTSGSKGIQLYVPLNTDVSYEETKPFAHALAELLEKRHPDRIVSKMKTDLRTGKVFIDWSQNDEHKTTVAVYSLRARERPWVSTPVAWDELERAAEKRDGSGLRFEWDVLLERVERRGDLFAPVLTLEQRLPDLKGRRAA
jgi:bifunctional non-homologous end joining protein LigD